MYRGYGLWWRCPCALILFLLLVVDDWSRDISGNVTKALVCGVILLQACDDESCIGTNDWTVNATFSPKIRTNCCWIAVNSLLGVFCGDATHSWWLTFQMSVAGRNAITNLGTDSFYSLGVSPLMLRSSSLQTFAPVFSFYSVRLWLCKTAAELPISSSTTTQRLACYMTFVTSQSWVKSNDVLNYRALTVLRGYQLHSPD